MMWPYGFGYMGWWMILPAIIFWGVIIWLIVWGVKRFTGGGSMHTHSALDTAKERYARGEITKEQFEQIKKDLS